MRFLATPRLAVICFFGVLFSATTHPQAAGPQPEPLPPAIPSPADTPYPGTISLVIDITNVRDAVFDVHESIPVKGKHVILLYPQWVPGAHSPANPISGLAGLAVSANGKRIPWLRDRVNMYAFHVDIPKDATALDLNFQYLAPTKPRESRISARFANLTWQSALLYPAGFFSRRILFSPSVRLPEGWKFATALEVKDQHAGEIDLKAESQKMAYPVGKVQRWNQIDFKETTLNTLVDSPLYAGAHYARLDLSTGADNRVFLDVFADKPEQLQITTEELQFHRNLVEQAEKLFQSHHYDHYDFLLSVSDAVGGKGLEHHQSSEDGARGNYFTEWPAGVAGRDLLAHEYTHSWNGKFRRPADLWTANFNTPMQDDLLWVYEGMTQYWGYILTARAGMWTPEQTRDLIALIAANYEASRGREWRPLEDTTNQPIMSYRAQSAWPGWQRGFDYYTEALLIWLDADTKIRQMSEGRKSLDDFARLFFGIDNGSYVTRTYRFEDVVAALNQVQAYDWAEFLRSRIYELHPQVPTDGITAGGYRLIYNDFAPDWMKKAEGPEGASFATSIGIRVKPDGLLQDVGWHSPAFDAGVTSDMQIEAVNDQKFSIQGLREVILSSEKSNEPIKLLLKQDDNFLTAVVDYRGGLRYPHLQRVEDKPAVLDEIIAPLK